MLVEQETPKTGATFNLEAHFFRTLPYRIFQRLWGEILFQNAPAIHCFLHFSPTNCQLFLSVSVNPTSQNHLRVLGSHQIQGSLIQQGSIACAHTDRDEFAEHLDVGEMPPDGVALCSDRLPWLSDRLLRLSDRLLWLSDRLSKCCSFLGTTLTSEIPRTWQATIRQPRVLRAALRAASPRRAGHRAAVLPLLDAHRDHHRQRDARREGETDVSLNRHSPPFPAPR